MKGNEHGYILYSDMTRSKNLISGKTPIGVVVCSYADGGGQALALDSIGKYVWGDDRTDITARNRKDVNLIQPVSPAKKFDNYLTDFTAMIMDYKTKEIVYESHLIGNEAVSREDFAEYVKDVYSKYPMFMNIQEEFYCYKNGQIGICEIPRSEISKAMDAFK